MAHTAHLIPPSIHHTTPVEVSFRGLFTGRPESVASEWLKRLFPVGVHRLVARRWERQNEGSDGEPVPR